MSLEFILTALVLLTGAGWMVGETRGRPGAGILLALLAGPFGVAAAFFLERPATLQALHELDVENAKARLRPRWIGALTSDRPTEQTLRTRAEARAAQGADGAAESGADAEFRRWREAQHPGGGG